MRPARVRWRAPWFQWAGCEQVDHFPHGRDGRPPFFSAAKSNFKGPMVLQGEKIFVQLPFGPVAPPRHPREDERTTRTTQAPLGVTGMMPMTCSTHAKGG